MAAPILRQHAVKIGLLDRVAVPNDAIFISRRGTRTLFNESEVQEVFSRSGYRKIYAEDLPPEDQIRCVANARSVIGLHGAGMSHVMFRDPSQLGTVVEIFPCGYPTNWVRGFCSQTNDVWLGGMGDLEAAVISDLLGNAHARTHEQRSYRLDVRVATTLLEVLARINASSAIPPLEELIELVPPVRIKP